MIKRFHYFKPDHTSISPLVFSPETSSESSMTVRSEDIFEMYEILYKLSSSQPPLKIQVPLNFTVFQDQQKTTSSGGEKGNKIRVFLIGSQECPDLSPFLNAPVPVDRIEFQGCILYEKPIFEMICQLKDVKKVKFFFGRKQTLYFESDEWAKSKEEEDEDRGEQIFTEEINTNRRVNLSVTTLAIIVSRKLQERNQQEGKENLLGVIERIVSRILKRAVISFPHLRKLTMTAPGSHVMHSAVLFTLNNFKYLKKTLVEFSEDELLVSKAPDEEVFIEGELQNQKVVDKDDEEENEPEILEPPINEQEMSDSEGKSDLDDTIIDLNKDETILEEQENVETCVAIEDVVEMEKVETSVIIIPDKVKESAPGNLAHFSKVLESMLGIGSAVAASTSIQVFQVNDESKPNGETFAKILSKMA